MRTYLVRTHNVTKLEVDKIPQLRVLIAKGGDLQIHVLSSVSEWLGIKKLEIKILGFPHAENTYTCFSPAPH